MRECGICIKSEIICPASQIDLTCALPPPDCLPDGGGIGNLSLSEKLLDIIMKV